MDTVVDVRSLVALGDDEFEKRIAGMEMDELIEAISGIQSTMALEQSNFDELTQDLSQIADSSSLEYQAKSEQLVASQERLADLMQRNMKCFTQQAANENKHMEEDLQEPSSQNQSQPVQSGNVNLVLTSSNQMSNNSAPLKNSNGVSANGKQNGADSKQNGGTNASQKVSPWASKQKGYEKPLDTANSDYNRFKSNDPSSNTSQSKSFMPSYVDSKSNQNVAKMEPQKVTVQMSSASAGSELSASNDPMASQNDQEPEEDLPKSGTLLGLRGMFEKSDANAGGSSTATKIPRSTSYVRESTKNSSSSGSTSGAGASSLSSTLPKSKSDNFVTNSNGGSNGNNGTSAVRSSTTVQLSQPSETSQSRRPSQPMSQSSHFSEGPQHAGKRRGSSKMPWYQQVTQMAYDGPPAISATTQNVRRPSGSTSGSTAPTRNEGGNYGGSQGSLGKETVNQVDKSSERKISSSSSSPVPTTTKTATTYMAVNNNSKSQQQQQQPQRQNTSAIPANLSQQPSKQQVGVVSGGGSSYRTSGNTIVFAAEAGGSKNQDQEGRNSKVPPTITTTSATANNNNGDDVDAAKKTTTHYEKNPQVATAKLEVSSKSADASFAPSPGLLQRSTSTKMLSTETTVQPMTKDSQGFTTEDSIEERVTLKHWDPTALLEDLYQVRLQPEASEESSPYINMEGYMEKLPMNKKKATLLKTWKRRYFKAMDGTLYYFENSMDDEELPEQPDAQVTEKASGTLPLSGGNIEELNNNMIGIDDGRGRYLIVRCPNDPDYQKWLSALTSQTKLAPKTSHVRPVLQSLPNVEKKVIVIDLGSANTRAGILGNQPSLPEVFLPTIVATNKKTGEKTFGIKALSTSVRAESKISYPIKPTAKVDKFTIDMEMMPGLFTTVFSRLKVNPKEYWVILSAPGNMSDKYKAELLDLLVGQFGVEGAHIMSQSMLALYAYSATSGIVVDIGERSEILPVTDGYIVEGGVTRQNYGGNKVAETLNTTLTERKYRFFTDVEAYIVRLAQERLTFVSSDYGDDLKRCLEEPEDYRESVSLEEYGLPNGSWTHVSNDVGRFKAPEGLFQQEVWEMDNPPLPKLIQTAIQACPMDARREMWRSIYLSGGVTMTPGFEERLQKDLEKIAPTSIKVEVHASPQRYHAAYIGACALALMPVFLQSCISASEWKQHGAQALRKWHTY